MGANWECAVPGIPVINVAHAQNRKIDAGLEFTASQYRLVSGELTRLGRKIATDEGISEAIGLLNKRRAALRRFSALASAHPDVVPTGVRNVVIKSSYFMDAGVYTPMLEELNEGLAGLPEKAWTGARVVTTGILADSPQLLKMLDENNISIAGDLVLYESLSFNEDVPDTDDPYVALAKRLAAVEGTSVLYDPGKRRAKEVLELVRKTSADGVIFILTKFCDPEEYDYVPVKKLLDANDVPCLLVEVDRQVSGYEQARNAIEAFSDIIKKQ